MSKPNGSAKQEVPRDSIRVTGGFASGNFRDSSGVPQGSIRVTGDIASGNFSDSLQEINVEHGEARDGSPLVDSPTNQPEEDKIHVEDTGSQAADRGPFLQNQKDHPEEDLERLVSKTYERVNESNVMEKALTDDIYSLLYTSRMGGLAFWFAVGTFTMQLAILGLICTQNSDRLDFEWKHILLTLCVLFMQ